MQLRKQWNLKFYAFLVNIFLCTMKLKLRFIISAKLRMRNDVQLGPIEHLIGHLFSENWIFLLFIKNQFRIWRELSYTILFLSKGFLYWLKL